MSTSINIHVFDRMLNETRLNNSDRLRKMGSYDKFKKISYFPFFIYTVYHNFSSLKCCAYGGIIQMRICSNKYVWAVDIIFMTCRHRYFWTEMLLFITTHLLVKVTKLMYRNWDRNVYHFRQCEVALSNNITYTIVIRGRQKSLYN